MEGARSLNVRYLHYILAIAEKRNMTKAAEALYVSQSSLSQYLAKLEREVGAPLFLRTRGELSLTPAGELYVEAARQVVEIRRELYQKIAALDGRGHISIGVTSQFGLEMLSQVIPAYKAQFPQVTIDITEAGLDLLTERILDESMDCAVMALNTLKTFSADQAMLLRREEVLFAVPSDHPWCREHPGQELTPAQLIACFGGAHFILSKQGSTLRVLAETLFQEQSFRPDVLCEISNIAAAKSMVARGIGVAFLARSCIEPEDEGIAYLSLSPALSRLNALVWRKNWVQNDLETAFLTAVKDYFVG